ncbi:sugar-binding protein [Clostridium botulinum]|uniref:transglutaminase domain-containing protein n=1 Tax=Clostridium sp. MIL1 TaxID=2949982 RepID=UPI0013CC79F0|nr:transglutaminase domain-containing protein [Clostridium sp. MIL1]NFI01462.1 sugar-binding protein [Clostridium botulinum]NFI64000.1 sugar-binding protein [Clostridium botulinum]NFJ44764.1 sugar-binding protein [Clostridium botulinum]NFJ48392.1 sugar-binding protein [Clostridium botulinum]NFK26226.1 sugar-binding protein [Clostridium botulinum]
MKKRNQIISSLIAIALTTSITNTFAYADDKKTNDKVNTKTYNKELNELDEATLKLDQIKVTTGAAAFINPIENNDNDKIFKENDEESITIKTGARTLDEYLKSKLPKNNRRVKRYSSLSLFQSNKEDIKARLKDGMENYKTNIDIKDLIDLDDINNNSNKILDLYFDVIYENPQIFYCNPTSVKFDNCTYNPSTGKLNSCDIKVNYEYNNDVIDKMREKLNNKINYIKKNYLDECSTDLEIEYAIHDYITQNCTYDKDNYDKKTVPNISHTSYGALINQIAVCDGYSKATMLLLNEYGIEAGIVTNDSHAWNYVNIDGNYYQTDLTWDDPTPETNKITYKNFNCSDNVMRKIHPWTSTIPERCTDTTFDDLFRIINGNSVNGKNSVRIKDKLYYLDGTDLWKCNLDGSDKTLFSKNITQSANMVNLVTNDNDIYYLSELEIKKINTNDKKIDTFKNLSDEFNFTSGRYSVQFYIKNSKLNIRFGQSKNDSNLKFTTKEYELKATPEKSDDKPQNIVKVDKSNLITIYNHNKDKINGTFTDETWNTFLQSLNQAKNILDIDDATQLDINNALSNLQTSINNLKDKPKNIVKVDKSNLIAIYDHNKDKVKGTFTDETWNTFLQSLNQAKNILDRDDTTQLDINNALSNLQTSINNLKDKPKNIVKVDKSNLIAIYNHNKDKVKGIFTDETWNTFLQSLNQAKNILDRDDVTQLNINNALSNLQTSINNLKDKPKNIVKVDNVNHSSSGGSSGGGGCSTKKSSENKTSMLNEDNTAISTTKITDNNPSNLNIITTVKNFAQTLTAINNINKKISVDEIYEINNNNFNGTIANLKSNDNNYIYVSCTSTLGNSNINSLKIDANKLNSKEKYIYTLDAVTNKLIFINSVQDDLIEIQASNQVQYVLSDTLFQSLKNNDWNKVNNDWLYIENGHTVTGWIKTVDNNWYHMDGNGLMQKGWIQDNNKWYYLNQDGSMKTGWFKDISGNWYYLNPNGSMATNTNINGYYINQYGIWQ